MSFLMNLMISVQVYVIFENKLPAAILIPGDYFGEVSLHHRLPRTETVVCQNDSVLLAISYETYYNFIQPVIEHQIALQYYQLKPAAIFYQWSELALALILHHLKVVKLQRNQYLYIEGQVDKAFYVVKSGEIIIQQTMKLRGKKHENKLVVLNTGQCFGDFEFLENQTWYSNRNQLELISRITSAISPTSSEVYRVPLIEYLQIADNYQSVLLEKYLKSHRHILKDRITVLQKQIEILDNSDELDLQEKQYVPIIKSVPANPYQNLLQTIRSRKVLLLKNKNVSNEQNQEEQNIDELKNKFQNFFFKPINLSNQQQESKSRTHRSSNFKQRINHITKADITSHLSERKMDLDKLQTMRDKLLAQSQSDFNKKLNAQRKGCLHFSSSPVLCYQDYQSLNIKSYNISRSNTPSQSIALKTVTQEQSNHKNDIHNIKQVKQQQSNSFVIQQPEASHLVKRMIIETKKSKRSSFACLITQI